MAIDVKHWSRCKFDHTPKVNLNTNKHMESFNGWLDSLRHSPPIQLLESLREQHTQLMYTRHVISQRYQGKLPPKVKNVITTATKRSRNCIVRRCGEYEFQVEFQDYKGAVKLDDKYCECEMWQVSGIPCFHAVACINTIRAQVEDYCDHFFSIDNWRKCYAGVIHPIPSMNMWPPFENNDLQPPTARPLPGRPKKRRRRAEGEPQPRTRVQSSTKRCKNCNAFGHNRRTCTTTAASSNQAARGRSRGGGRVGSRGRGRGATELQPHEEITTSQPDVFATQESQN